MRKLYWFLFIIFVSIVAQSNAISAEILSKTESFSPNQTEQIQQIIHDYIVNNPSVLLEAGQKYQEQEATKEQARTKKIKENALRYRKEVFAPTRSGRIITGNPNGKVIIAEFSQYQCPHCKAVAPYVDRLLKDNPDVQLITIYWPFYGNDAVYASKAALAAQKQNKFDELNKALIAVQEFITKDKVDNVIKTIPGLDAKKLYKDMNDKELDNGLKANIKLAKDLELGGMPVFIITNREQTKLSLILGQTQNIAEDLNQSLKSVR